MVTTNWSQVYLSSGVWSFHISWVSQSQLQGMSFVVKAIMWVSAVSVFWSSPLAISLYDGDTDYLTGKQSDLFAAATARVSAFPCSTVHSSVGTSLFRACRLSQSGRFSPEWTSWGHSSMPSCTGPYTRTSAASGLDSYYWFAAFFT